MAPQRKDHVCEDCGIAFPTKGRMRDHRRNVHLGRAKLSCNVCASTFATAEELAKHKHDVEKQLAVIQSNPPTPMEHPPPISMVHPIGGKVNHLD